MNRSNKFKPLAETLFASSAKAVARRLLGHWLVRQTGEVFCGGPIVETEAYLQNDPACHAARGETARNRAMFGPPGRAYVYFVYGNHWCFNAVCHRIGVGEAVLVRAIEAFFGKEFMQQNREVKKETDLTNGPAKLCEAMKINGALNNGNLSATDSPVFIAENPKLKTFIKSRGPIITTPRIGLSIATELPLRFYLAKSPFISRKHLS